MAGVEHWGQLSRSAWQGSGWGATAAIVRMASTCRILQLSDPHLLADPRGTYRDRAPLPLLRHGLAHAWAQAIAGGRAPDLLLISGDLCQDESWGGYARLRDLLAGVAVPLALLAGNHDDATLLTAALVRRAVLAPALIPLGEWDLLLLDSHRPGCTEGWLGALQLEWLRSRLAERAGRSAVPLLVAVHHPPVPIGDAEFDRIALADAPALLAQLAAVPRLGGLVFGHVHQHWVGSLPGRPEVPLLGCPSTLCGFGPVQLCPLGRPHEPGGRILDLLPEGEIRQQLLRWPLPDVPTVG